MKRDPILINEIEAKLEALRFRSDSQEITKQELQKLIGNDSFYQKFWDAESLMWEKRISPEIKEKIGEELKSFSQGKVLNIGSGSFNYVQLNENSVCLDYSPFMLLENTTQNKVLYDLNFGALPFSDGVFDNILSIFVLNYLENPKIVLDEFDRVLGKRGKVIVLQSKLNSWYNTVNLHEVHEIEKMLMEKFVIKNRKVFYGISFYECNKRED